MPFITPEILKEKFKISCALLCRAEDAKSDPDNLGDLLYVDGTID